MKRLLCDETIRKSQNAAARLSHLYHDSPYPPSREFEGTDRRSLIKDRDGPRRSSPFLPLASRGDILGQYIVDGNQGCRLCSSQGI